ncbi:hypothetical protein PL10110_640061 [Planktothrix agardhii]|nr:hypothetical protein PL10110_640061 [Planktothrix agardhii]
MDGIMELIPLTMAQAVNPLILEELQLKKPAIAFLWPSRVECL